MNSELSQFLASLPPEVVEAAYADSMFVALHGKNENLARVWFTERLLIEEAARRRLRSLAEVTPLAKAMPYSADCLRDVSVDNEFMVRLAVTPTSLVKEFFAPIWSGPFVRGIGQQLPSAV